MSLPEVVGLATWSFGMVMTGSSWTVTVGSEEQRHLSKQFNDKHQADSLMNQKSELRKQERTISCFLQGLIKIIANLLCGKGISLNGLFPRQSFSLNTS